MPTVIATDDDADKKSKHSTQRSRSFRSQRCFQGSARTSFADAIVPVRDCDKKQHLEFYRTGAGESTNALARD